MIEYPLGDYVASNLDPASRLSLRTHFLESSDVQTGREYLPTSPVQLLK